MVTRRKRLAQSAVQLGGVCAFDATNSSRSCHPGTLAERFVQAVGDAVLSVVGRVLVVQRGSGARVLSPLHQVGQGCTGHRDHGHR